MYTITKDVTLLPGMTTRVRFFVRYSMSEKIPEIKTILLNGKLVCSSSKVEQEVVSTRQIRPVDPVIKPRPEHVNKPAAVTNPIFQQNPNIL